MCCTISNYGKCGSFRWEFHQGDWVWSMNYIALTYYLWFISSAIFFYCLKYMKEYAIWISFPRHGKLLWPWDYCSDMGNCSGANILCFHNILCPLGCMDMYTFVVLERFYSADPQINWSMNLGFVICMTAVHAWCQSEEQANLFSLEGKNIINYCF